MITRLRVSCVVWNVPSFQRWLVKFDYEAIKDCIELNFIFLDTEEVIEADMDRRFPR